MASITQTSPLGTPLNPSKVQDGPYQIELEDIESDETNTTTTGSSSGVTSPAPAAKSHTSPMKPENHFITGFTGTGQNDAEPPSRSSTYAVRACVCAFAILLLWLTSLNLSKVFVVGTIRAPDQEDVIDWWNKLADKTSAQYGSYATCADQQLIGCNKTINDDTDAQLDRVATNTAINKNILDIVRNAASTCGSLTIELSQSIKTWKDNPLNNIIYNYGICTQAEIDEVKQWVDRPDLIHNQAYILATSYSSASDARSQRMLAYASNFTAYNQMYFANKLGLNNQMFGELNNLVPGYSDVFGNLTTGLLGPAQTMYNCMSLAQSAAITCPNGARAAWDSGSAPAKNAYQNVKDKLQIQINSYNSVTGQMKSMLNAIKSFFDDFLAPAAYGLSQLNIPLGSFPSTSFTVPLPTSLGTDVPWFDPGNLNVSAHFAAFGAAVSASAQQSRTAASDWYANQSAVTGVLPHYFDDYNPPPLIGPMQDEAQAQADSSVDFRSQSAYALNQQAPQEQKNDTVQVVKGFLSDKATLVAGADFHFEPLGGNLLLRPLLDVIPNLYLFALAIDYIWRAYRSVRLIIKYWFQSAVGLPVIDVRDYENHAGARGPVKAVAVATHPGTVVAVIAIVLALALASIVPPYTSLLDAYEEGCVQTNDGTVLTNNTYAVAYNYAQSQGNGKLNEGYQQLNAYKNNICGQHLQGTTDAQNANIASLTSAQNSQKENARQTTLIAKCVNFTNMGTPEQYNASVGMRHPALIVADAIDPLHPLDTTHPCMPLAVNYTLSNAVFDCSALETCTSSCGPSAEIPKYAFQAGCKTEYMIHSFIARFWVTFLVFICLNLSRMLFMAAIVRLGWRSLTPRGFEFISNCTRVGETSKTINSQLVVQLNKSIANYERFAIVLFGMAVLIHIPYIAVLATINQAIAFNKG